MTLEIDSSSIGLTNHRKGDGKMEKDRYSVKELRIRTNWTQERTAKNLGISTQTYNAWEQNFGMVKVQNASRVAALFGVSMESIFFNEKVE